MTYISTDLVLQIGSNNNFCEGELPFDDFFSSMLPFLKQLGFITISLLFLI